MIDPNQALRSARKGSPWPARLLTVIVAAVTFASRAHAQCTIGSNGNNKTCTASAPTSISMVVLKTVRLEINSSSIAFTTTPVVGVNASQYVAGNRDMTSL